MRFNDLPVADGTLDAIAAMGYEEATPIQRDAIPHLLNGRDVIGRAQTGTGKTAAFGIPMVNALRDAEEGIHGLVLCPTRELAIQVTEVLADLAKGSRIRVVPVYGGAGFDKQERGLRQRTPLIVVACPGRLLDLVGRGVADLSQVTHWVLDEADRMLDMGFIHDMRRVEKLLPKNRQTALFSATFDGQITKLSKDFLVNPITIEVEDTITTDLVDDYHIKVEKSAKKQLLFTLLAEEMPGKAIVFTRMKHQAKRVAQDLNGHGWASVALQGNMTQGQRERAMAAFRDGKARILVATDVAARGLDVPDVTHIVNFDLPMKIENYVHRVGRTGRNGQTGRAHSFVQSDEHDHFRDIKRYAGDVPIAHLVPDNQAPRGPDAPVAFSPPQQQQRQGGGGRRSNNGQRQGARSSGHNHSGQSGGGGQGRQGQRSGGYGGRRN